MRNRIKAPWSAERSIRRAEGSGKREERVKTHPKNKLDTIKLPVCNPNNSSLAVVARKKPQDPRVERVEDGGAGR